MGVLKSLRRLISRQALCVAVLVAYPVLTHAAVTTGLGYLASAAWLCLAALLYLSFPGKWGLAGFALLAAAPLVAEPDVLLKLPPVIFNVALAVWFGRRSEEHTSELQSLAYLVCRLLLEKKKKNQ